MATLNETELRNYLAKKINEALEDEGLWGGIKNVWNANRGKYDAQYNNEKGSGKWSQAYHNGNHAEELEKASKILSNEMFYLDAMGFNTTQVCQQLDNIIANLKRGGVRRTRQQNGRFGKNQNYNYNDNQPQQTNGMGRQDTSKFVRNPMSVGI